MSLRLLALILISTWPAFAHAEAGPHEPFEITGHVIKNNDGDTIKLKTDEQAILTIRLSGADTPETGQAYWRVARDNLGSQVAEKPVTAWCYKRDRHDREVCHVTVNGSDPGLALVKQGLAWYGFMFANELTPTMRKSYQAAEAQAREQRLGLWQESEPMPPWECRKLKNTHPKCR